MRPSSVGEDRLKDIIFSDAIPKFDRFRGKSGALSLLNPSIWSFFRGVIDGKEALLRRVLERAATLLESRVDEIYAADLSPGEKLGRALENHALTVMENLDLVSVYLQEYHSLSPQQLNQVLMARAHYERVLTQILKDGIASGDFRPVDIKMTLLGFLGMLNWTHQWFSPDGPLFP